jgi:hypothetical protein
MEGRIRTLRSKKMIDKIWEQITEDNWTQGAYCRDKDARPSSEADAVSFCLSQWITEVYGVDTLGSKRVRNKIIKAIDFQSILTWNDDKSRTFNDVKRLCRDLDI